MIWILWHRRIGDLNQMRVLAEVLGGPVVVKNLQFFGPKYGPLAALLLNREKSDSLSEPWPKLVICAEALTSVIARRLKTQSGGAIKTVCLARPSGDVRNFDLVLTTAQFRLAPLPNVVELTLPLILQPTKIAAEAKFITVLIGASSPPEVLDSGVAVVMLDRLRAYADKKNIPLCVITSPRTRAEVARIFSENLKAPHQVHVWQSDGENPYQQSLNEALEIIVTSDSVSMLADALVAGKPVSVYKLPRALSYMQRLVAALYARWPQALIFRAGLIESTTDRWLLIDQLVVQNFVNWFGENQKPLQVFDPQQDIDTAVGVVRKLITPSS